MPWLGHVDFSTLRTALHETPEALNCVRVNVAII